MDTLALFGFEPLPARSAKGELVLAKRLRPGPDGEGLTPLEHHVRYGPPAIADGTRLFAVPIVPRWHDELFPDAPRLATPRPTLPGLEVMVTHPWGNAIRKAYLSKSRTGLLRQGDTLMFYESRPVQAVRAVGVVEDVLPSADPNEIVAFGGRRTVYGFREIETMCRQSVDGVLAVLFRQDRFVDPPWDLGTLTANGVLRSWPPQTISRVPDGRSGWILAQLAG